MGARHHHILDWDPSRSARAAFGLVENLARDHAAVAEDEGQSVLAIIEYQASRPEFVVDMRSLPIPHTAGDREAEGRGDIALGRAGLENFLGLFLLRLSRRGSKWKKSE
jgi:hypothetical protein